MHFFSLFLRFFSRPQPFPGSVDSRSVDPCSVDSRSARRVFVTALALLVLVVGVLYSNRSSFLLAQTGNPVLVVTGGGDVSSYVGASNSNITFNASVTGAPVQGSECTLTGTGTPGPWSGPSYEWFGPTITGPSPGITATLTPRTGSSAVAVTISYTNATPGTYTVFVNAEATYTSNCGSKKATGVGKSITVTVTGKVWTPDSGLTVLEVSPGPAVAGDPIYVANGGSVQLGVSASDNDRWALGPNSGTEADTLKYTWSGSGSFGSSTSSSTSWTAPTLAAGVNSADYSVSCEVDDTPKAIASGESGNRNDASVTKSRLIRVVRKLWTADPALVVSPVSPGSQGQYYIVENGSSVGLSVTASDDSDSWTLGTSSGTEADTTPLTYSWTGGTGGTFGTPNSSSTNWTPPALAEGETSKDFTVSCRVDDTPKTIPATEGGTRNDSATTQSRLIRVVRKVWSADTPISGGDLTVTGETTGGTGGTTLVVEEGAQISASVALATDSDKWIKGTASGGTTTGTDADDMTYTWSAAFGSLSQTDGRSTTWTAPDLSEGTKEGTYTFKCRIDDTPKAIASNESGSRDDDALDRTVTVKVIQKVWDKGDPISGGDTFTVNGVASGNYITVDPGVTLEVGISPATDTDHWIKNGEEDTEADDLTYNWTSTLGATSIGQNVSFNTGTLLPGVDSVQITLTCEIKDTPKAITGRDSGNRDDDNKSSVLTINIARKVWGPGQGIQGGDLTSPGEVTIAPGASVAVAVSNATDSDSWIKGSLAGSDNDTITYHWSCLGGGSFADASASGTTWTPPSLPEGTNSQIFRLVCTIDDTPTAIAVGEGGRRDDRPKRTNVTVTMVGPEPTPTPTPTATPTATPVPTSTPTPTPTPDFCSIYTHDSWSAGEIEWDDDLVPSATDATEVLKANGLPDQSVARAYQQTDFYDARDDNGVLTRYVVYQADSRCSGDSTTLSGSHALPEPATGVGYGSAAFKILKQAEGSTAVPTPTPDPNQPSPAYQALKGRAKDTVYVALDLSSSGVHETAATVRLFDHKSGLADTESHIDVPVDFTLTTGWQKEYDPDKNAPGGNGPKVKGWWPAPEAPYGQEGHYRYLIPWATADGPWLAQRIVFTPTELDPHPNGEMLAGKLWNQNGSHTISLSSVNQKQSNTLTFGTAAQASVNPIDVTVDNPLKIEITHCPAYFVPGHTNTISYKIAPNTFSSPLVHAKIYARDQNGDITGAALFTSGSLSATEGDHSFTYDGNEINATTGKFVCQLELTTASAGSFISQSNFDVKAWELLSFFYDDLTEAEKTDIDAFRAAQQSEDDDTTAIPYCAGINSATVTSAKVNDKTWYWDQTESNAATLSIDNGQETQSISDTEWQTTWGQALTTKNSYDIRGSTVSNMNGTFYSTSEANQWFFVKVTVLEGGVLDNLDQPFDADPSTELEEKTVTYKLCIDGNGQVTILGETYS